jgi:hypothetical protein
MLSYKKKDEQDDAMSQRISVNLAPACPCARAHSLKHVLTVLKVEYGKEVFMLW